MRIFPLPDVGLGNNIKWGNYVIDKFVERFGKMPDLFITGKEQRRLAWFDEEEGASVAELYIPKTIDISATRMREYLIDGEYDLWKKNTPSPLWDDFDSLRKTVILSAPNKESDSI